MDRLTGQVALWRERAVEAAEDAVAQRRAAQDAQRAERAARARVDELAYIPEACTHTTVCVPMCLPQPCMLHAACWHLEPHLPCKSEKALHACLSRSYQRSMRRCCWSRPAAGDPACQLSGPHVMSHPSSSMQEQQCGTAWDSQALSWRIAQTAFTDAFRELGRGSFGVVEYRYLATAVKRVRGRLPSPAALSYPQGSAARDRQACSAASGWCFLKALASHETYVSSTLQSLTGSAAPWTADMQCQA